MTSCPCWKKGGCRFSKKKPYHCKRHTMVCPRCEAVDGKKVPHKKSETCGRCDAKGVVKEDMPVDK